MTFELVTDRRMRGCSVYLVADGQKALKIGMSADPEKRLRELLTSSPGNLRLAHSWRLASRAQAASLERELHALFAPRRVAREWFALAISHVVPVAEMLIRGEGSCANIAATAVALALDCEDAAEGLSAKRASLAPRWHKPRRDALAAAAEASWDKAEYWWAWAHHIGHDLGAAEYAIHRDTIACLLAPNPAPSSA